MSTPNLEDTAPNNPLDDTSPVRVYPGPVKKAKSRRWLWILLGLLIIFIGIAVGSLIGYADGKSILDTASNRQRTLEAATQFQLALADQKAGNYDFALKRLQHIINNLDPKFPGAQEKLVEVMMAMASSSTLPTAPPVATPTPSFTATPDTRGEADLLAGAHQALVDKDWDRTIQTLDNLRKRNKAFQAVAVDGMYYVALRNRGMEKINRGQLEEGMYDMALAARFAPLDKDAEGYKSLARLYVTGTSFWGVDWTKVLNIFSQLYASVPALRDSTGMSVAGRYREALLSYAQQLEKDSQYCDAEQQYQLAWQVSPDETKGKKATEISGKCRPEVTETPTPEVTGTAKPTRTPKATTVETTEVPTTEVPPTEAPPTETPQPPAGPTETPKP
jgi:tetratricopeptide (TPR) repeat protein